jgi:hypothetical protein
MRAFNWLQNGDGGCGGEGREGRGRRRRLKRASTWTGLKDELELANMDSGSSSRGVMPNRPSPTRPKTPSSSALGTRALKWLASAAGSQ